MIERLTSLRVWLLLAMLATALVAILAGNFITDRLNAGSEVAADRAKALLIARSIAAQVQRGNGAPQLRAVQEALPDDQLVVIQGGRTVFAGPSMARLPLELTVSAPIPGGRVILHDHSAPAAGGLAQSTLVAGVIAALIIAEAWLAATLLVRTVRKPLGRAIEAADRLAAGDFAARMGVSGPEEFARLGRAFDSMATQLQHTDTEQKRFLADLAHEVATPVSALSGFAVALVDGSVRTAADRAEAASIVVHESGRLQRLFDDVRSLNQLDLTQSARREQIDVNELCAQTAQRFQLAADKAGVALRVRAGHVSVTTDPRLVETVVNNFVSNAIRYTPPGGTVEIRARRRRTAALIAVRDTGTGIAAEHLEKIFDRLYRADQARDRTTGGSGLGLAIARRAAQSIGARIEVDSTPQAGSEFRLILPPRRATSTGKERLANAHPKSRSNHDYNKLQLPYLTRLTRVGRVRKSTGVADRFGQDLPGRA
ncbi:MAG: HAMP domain-containing histidine kinase [Actinomycetota bacterium]|nr:HAMP domain-containing histidine kinase [Actinomycetota bacterium]